MEKVTTEFVVAYQVCSENKRLFSKLLPVCYNLPVPLTSPVITGLPPSDGNTVILTVVNRFSKAAHFIPLLKLPSAKQTAELMLHHIFGFQGLSRDVVSEWVSSLSTHSPRPNLLSPYPGPNCCGLNTLHNTLPSSATGLSPLPALPGVSAPTLPSTGAGGQGSVCPGLHSSMPLHLVTG